MPPRAPIHRLSATTIRSIIRWTACSLLIVGLFHPAIKFHYNHHSRDQIDQSLLEFEDQDLPSLSFNAPIPTSKFGVLLQPVIQRDIQEQDEAQTVVQSDRATMGGAKTRSGCPSIRRDTDHGCVAEAEKYGEIDVLDDDDATNNEGPPIIIRHIPQSAAPSTLQPTLASNIDQSSPTHVLAARWGEWFNPEKCMIIDYEDATELDDCKKRENMKMIKWCALAVLCLCTLAIMIIQLLDCIRRRGAVSHDLSQIMSEKSCSTAPKIRNPIQFRLDGEIIDADETEEVADDRNELMNKRMRTGTGEAKQVDEEADIGVHECKSPDSIIEGWSSWFANKRYQATLTRKPTPRCRLPRIPSLTLPKPCLATVRKASGLDFYEELEDEKLDDNFSDRKFSRRGTVIRWHNV